jgi:hypothetical protein
MLDTDNTKSTTWLKFFGCFLLCSQRRLFLRFLAKLEYFLDILIHRLVDLTKKSKIIDKKNQWRANP